MGIQASINDFLARGYFPRELPPSFTTASFAAAIGSQTGLFQGSPRTAKLCAHNIAKPGTLRRRLGIPNPVLFYRLVETLATHWSDIAQHVNASPFSFSKPTSRDVYRAIVPARMFEDMEQARLALRARASLILRTDINQFYGSIYTHSIPWALHGKVQAKSNRRCTLLGNALDEGLRNAQDGQTIGIPMGPDTSLVIAEIILAAVDSELAQTVSANAACRRVDDYEIRVDNRAHAERTLGKIQQVLNDYELVLNPRKTGIIELPCAFADGWRHEVRRFRLRKAVKSQHYDLLAFFDLAFRTASEHPDQSGLKYAVSRLRRTRIDPANWEMHERFLHQAILAEPGVTSEAVSQLIRFQASGMTLDLPGLAEVVNRLIEYHAPQGHGTEVAWAIWTALAFQLTLSSEALDTAEEMPDSVVALLLLDAENQGRLPRPIATTRWREFMMRNELYGEQWLLSYEARLKGWRASRGSADHIAGDPHFSWMRAQGVTFYEPVTPPVPPPVAKVADLMEEEALGFSPA